MINKRGILLIIILIVVAGLATSIAITIPREVKVLARHQEEKFRDSLMNIENGVNTALREHEFYEVFPTTDINDVDGDNSTTEVYLDYYDSNSTYTNWTKVPSGNGYYIKGEQATKFLDNLSYEKGLGFIPMRSYRINKKDPLDNDRIGPIFNNKPSRWVVIITEVSDITVYNSYDNK